MKKILKNIIFVFGCIFLLVILAILSLFPIFAIDDHIKSNLSRRITNNDIEYVEKNIKKYSKEKREINLLIRNKQYDMLSVLIKNDLVSDKNITECFKYDNDVIDLFVEKHGLDNRDILTFITSSLGPEKLEYYINLGGHYDLQNILIEATKAGNYSLLEYLVEEKNANIYFSDDNNMNLLFYLITNFDKHEGSNFTNGKMISFIYLVNKGVDLKQKDLKGRSILSYSYTTNIYFLNYLFQSGFDVNEQDLLGNTVLHQLYKNTMEGNYYNKEIRDYLLIMGAREDIKNNAGQTPEDCRLPD